MRFSLRTIRTEDAPSIQKNAHDPIIAKMTLLIPYPYQYKHAVQWIKILKRRKQKKPRTDIVFGIDVKGAIVGAIGLHNIDYTHKKAEVGYWLGKDYRGKGIMPQALKKVVTHAWKKLHITRIYAYVHTDNPASTRVLEKVGFEREGTLKKQYYKDGRAIDTYIYAKIR